MFAADGVTRNIFKDYATIREAVGRIAAALPNAPPLLLALGQDAPAERVGRAEVRFLQVCGAEEMAVYYQAADVYLHAARADTFPNVVLEAMACGTPVVATAVGGIPEQVEHGVSGFLVPPGDSSGMAERESSPDGSRNAMASARGRRSSRRAVRSAGPT